MSINQVIVTSIRIKLKALLMEGKRLGVGIYKMDELGKTFVAVCVSRVSNFWYTLYFVEN